jgi:hypothetical protein
MPQQHHVSFLASSDRLAEDVVILAVVIPELEFSDVERQVFAARLVIGTDSAALDIVPVLF